MTTAIMPPIPTILLAALLATTTQADTIEVRTTPAPDTFPLVGQAPAAIVCDPDDATVVSIAANLLADDVRRVTNLRPQVLDAPPTRADALVVIGAVGASRPIDALIRTGKLNVAAIKDQWEAYTIAVINDPFPNVNRALVIAGADRRGAAYGVFTLSESIGVSPWYYWADVPTAHQNQLHIVDETIVQGAPSVKYRGIFINDEDWGMHPWAARQIDTDIRDIGPKTYARVFELLLRLKANYIWPAMHACTQAFNSYPQNKHVADDYAIVMGASHCEPMLRNNVTEWNHRTMGAWDYETNRDGVYKYWEDRVEANGRFENLYTVGMRGIHDSDMPGGGSLADKRRRLERVIRDQREILARHVNADPADVPQIFCPYKEVLAIYADGLDLPDDITIVWPDDNFGYIRNLSAPAERRRSGGSGVYYHLSYLGQPEDFLWIASTSPALIAYEMGKAYAFGADRVWIFNVGDIKPAEVEMEFGLRLAYDINSYPPQHALDFIEDWAARTFGPAHAEAIAAVEKAYYRLTQQAKPEHINRVPFTSAERARRRAEYRAIVEQADAINARLDPKYRDAFFQLVLYPVKCAAEMDRKHTCMAEGDANGALDAHYAIRELTGYYNQRVAGGKWNGMMNANPNARPVFALPSAERVWHATREPVYLFQLEPKEAELSGAMQLQDNRIVATAPGKQPERNAHRTVFTLDADQARRATVHFLARCPDDNHDSWFVDFNGDRAVSNDQPTGDATRWLRIMDVDVKAGANRLTITQREGGTEIAAVALTAPGPGPHQPEINPRHTIPAGRCAAARDTSASQWHKIEGLGIEPHAMTVLPFASQPIDPEAYRKAPAITYAFTTEGDAESCTIEARFVPTHRINDGMHLRYAVTVDDGPPQVRDINAPEWSATWSRNVLHGYSSASTEHDVRPADKHEVTIYLLDPGMVLSQLRIY